MKLSNTKIIALLIYSILIILSGFYTVMSDGSIVGIITIVCITLLAFVHLISRTGGFLFGPITFLNGVIIFQFICKALWLDAGKALEETAPGIIKGLFYISIFILFYSITYLTMLLYFKKDFHYIKIIANKSRILEDTSLKRGLFFVGLGLVLFVLLSLLFGGSLFSAFQNPLEFRIFLQHNGMYYFDVLMFFLILFGIVILTKKYYERKTPVRTLILGIGLLLAVGIALGCGLRGRVLEMILAVFVVYNIRKQKNPSVKFFVLSVLAVPFVVLYGIYRDLVRGGEISFKEALGLLRDNSDQGISIISRFMHRFDAFDNFCYILADYSNFKYGKSFIDFFFQPIPRSILPNKPQIFTSEMTALFRPDLFDQSIALTYSGFGEMYVNFGFLGIVFAGIWVGILIYHMESIFIAARQSDFWLLWYISLYQYPFYILSSGFINDVGNINLIMYSVLCVFVTIYLKMEKNALRVITSKMNNTSRKT